MKYLIIGGAGIFALHTIKKILDLKDTKQVVSVGRNRERSSEAFTLGVGKGDERYLYKQIHLTFEIDFLTDLIDKHEPNYIINFAALAYATSWHKSSRYYDTNITAVAKLCEHLYEKKFLKQFLQIGSSEVYGGTIKPAKETDIPNPTSPYAISKLAADYHMLSLYNHMGFPSNVIRPSNCYGSGQYLYRLIPKAILYGLTGNKFPLEGGGKAMKSFMHAQDLADAIIAIINSDKFGKIYNAGVDKPNTIREIVECVAKNLNLDINEFCEITEGRKTEDSQYWINSELINNELNWKAKISLDEGIDEVVRWAKKYKDILIKEPQNFILRA